MTTSTLATRAASATAAIAHDTPYAALETFVREGWHNEVQRRLTAKYGRACGSGLVEEAIGHALEKASSRLEACHGRQVYVFVLTAAEHWLLDNSKGARRAQARGWAKRVELTALDQVPDDANPGIADSLATRDGDAMREEIASALLHRLEVHERLDALPPRVQMVMSLFHVEQLTKREIRERTGLTVKQLRTALAAGNKFLHDEYLAIESQLEAGNCSETQGAVARLVFNLARGREARAARAHVRHCISCAARMRHAEATRNALALSLPPAMLASPHIESPPLDHAIGVIAQVRAAMSRVLSNAPDLAQPASLAGVGQAMSGPVGAGLMKAAALCLAGGSIAATCIGVGTFESDQKTTGPTPSASDARAARSEARAATPRSPYRPIRTVTTTATPSPRRTTSKKRSAPKHSRSKNSPNEFFSPDATSSTAASQQAPRATVPTSASRSAGSQPAEFPIF